MPPSLKDRKEATPQHGREFICAILKSVFGMAAYRYAMVLMQPALQFRNGIVRFGHCLRDLLIHL